MEPTQFERLKQALKQQKDRGAITLEEYLEELDKLQVPQVSLQRQGATGAADSAAAADLLRMRQTPAAVTPSPQLLPSQSSGQERQQQRQSGPPSQSTLNSADWQSSQSRSNAQGSSPPASVAVPRCPTRSWRWFPEEDLCWGWGDWHCPTFFYA